MAEELLVERLDNRGSGLARTTAGWVRIAGALPGERVKAEISGQPGRAELVEVVDASPRRAQPFCPLFGQCGGCVLQHFAAEDYRAWKRGLVIDALSRAGLETEVAPLVDAHGAGRRRVTFHARFQPRAAVGFMAAGSHTLVEVAACAVLSPGLAGAADAARALAGCFAATPKPMDIVVLASTAGLDVDLRGCGELTEPVRAALIERGRALGLARLSNHGEVVVEYRPPVVDMGGTAVVPPPGAFLQATAAGEAALAELVLEATRGARRVADLFSGCGPFALRLAREADVHAVDSGDAMLRALAAAARAAAGSRPVSVERRDLYRRPLLVAELAAREAVVLDPPRAGAEAQCQQLAGADVPVVAYVSCDETSFARDAALLVAGGYRLESVTPVDQFKYTAHVELVGRFRKPARGKRRRGRP
ncbi:MAG: RNA methyltransferase [Methylobacteriaceae bacterium]|jgi:23S rRNA (uracil1939-C5)-methyltransferase|nr:RNA methyltransferase [Methylobacteriaceae bacterium]